MLSKVKLRNIKRERKAFCGSWLTFRLLFFSLVLCHFYFIFFLAMNSIHVRISKLTICLLLYNNCIIFMMVLHWAQHSPCTAFNSITLSGWGFILPLLQNSAILTHGYKLVLHWPPTPFLLNQQNRVNQPLNEEYNFQFYSFTCTSSANYNTSCFLYHVGHSLNFYLMSYPFRIDLGSIEIS